jgi:hypothetical protein
MGHALRGPPAGLADTDRVRVHLLRFTLAVRRKVVQPHGRDIDDDAFARCVRQHESRRHHDVVAGTGDPWIDAGIGPDDLLVTDVEAPGDIRQRVFLRGDRDLHIADDVILGIGQRELVRGDRRCEHRSGRRDRRRDRNRRRLRRRVRSDQRATRDQGGRGA